MSMTGAIDGRQTCDSVTGKCQSLRYDAPIFLEYLNYLSIISRSLQGGPQNTFVRLYFT